MPFTTQDKETTEFSRYIIEHNVGTAAGNVGSESDCTLLTRLGNDTRFTFIVLGIQDLVWNASFLKHAGKLFVLFNRHGTNQNWLALGMELLDLSYNCPELTLLGLIYSIRQVDTG